MRQAGNRESGVTHIYINSPQMRPLARNRPNLNSFKGRYFINTRRIFAAPSAHDVRRTIIRTLCFVAAGIIAHTRATVCTRVRALSKSRKLFRIKDRIMDFDFRDRRKKKKNCIPYERLQIPFSRRSPPSIHRSIASSIDRREMRRDEYFLR